MFAVEKSRNDGCGRITRFWSSRVSLPFDLQHALDHEHHVRAAGIVFVEHQRAGMLQAPRQNALAELGHLLAVAQHDGVLADQVDAADVAVEVHADAGPVQPRRHLLDMRGLACAVIALDHRAAVECETRQDRERRLAVELVRIVDIRDMLGAHREGRHDHVRLNLECLARGHLGVRQINRGGRANFGQSGNLVHRLGGSCLISEKSNPG